MFYHNYVRIRIPVCLPSPGKRFSTLISVENLEEIREGEKDSMVFSVSIGEKNVCESRIIHEIDAPNAAL